jgi:hypothetical protein
MPRSAKKPQPAPDPDAGKTTLELIEEVVPNAQQWLNTPNTRFGLRAPKELIGTPQESVLRTIVLAYKCGNFA